MLEFQEYMVFDSSSIFGVSFHLHRESLLSFIRKETNEDRIVMTVGELFEWNKVFINSCKFAGLELTISIENATEWELLVSTWFKCHDVAVDQILFVEGLENMRKYYNAHAKWEKCAR